MKIYKKIKFIFGLVIFMLLPTAVLAQTIPNIYFENVASSSETKEINAFVNLSNLPTPTETEAFQVRVVFIKQTGDYDVSGNAIQACQDLQADGTNGDWFVGSINLNHEAQGYDRYTVERSNSSTIDVVSPSLSGNEISVTNRAVRLSVNYLFESAGEKKMMALLMFGHGENVFSLAGNNDCGLSREIDIKTVAIHEDATDDDADDADDDADGGAGAGTFTPPSAPIFGTITLDTINTLLEPAGVEIPLIQRFIEILLILAGFFLVVMIIYSGILLLVADSDEQAEQAKKNLTWAVYGTVIILLSKWIVDFVIKYLR